jgi:uncharacterized C2H2 Zn-finger protein
MQYLWDGVNNFEVLIRHQTLVDVSKMLQCQSCGKVFDNKVKFEKHIAKIHGSSQQQLDSNLAKNIV